MKNPDEMNAVERETELRSRIERYITGDDCKVSFMLKASMIVDGAWEDWYEQDYFDEKLGINTRISTLNLFINSLVLRAHTGGGRNLSAIETPDDVESLLTEFREKFDAEIQKAAELMRRFPRLVNAAATEGRPAKEASLSGDSNVEELASV